MEEIQNTMRATQSRKLALRDARAMERFAKNPQLADSNMIVPTAPNEGIGEAGEAVPISGGGAAGLARMVGKGRKGKMMMEGASNGVMEGGGKHEGSRFGKSLKEAHGGASAAKFMESAPGREMMMKMAQLKGGAFSKEFREGFMEAMKDEDEGMAMKRGRGKASLGGVYGAGEYTPGGDGREVAHAKMMSARLGERGAALGGQDVPMAGMAPVAYGNAPQAPASFQRNTVGMGRASAMKGMGKLEIEVKHGDMMKGGARTGGARTGGAAKACVSGAMEGGKKKRMPSARNQAISRLMKEKGMSLGEASRHVKEHGC